MKKLTTISMLFILAVCGCDNENQNNKVSTVKETPSGIEEKAKPVFMAGELDEFHPDSEFESIRKTKLSPLGTLKNPPPAYTPDTETAWETMNASGFSTVNVEFINSNLPWRPKYPFDYENDLQVFFFFSY